MTPFEAATHAAPYPYYSHLREKTDLFFDPDLGLWVACGAAAVEAILQQPDCRVRPEHEPVPRAIAQGPAGDVFARLMRMNEGARQQCPRAAIEPALMAVPVQNVETLVCSLVGRADLGAESLNGLMFSLPVSVLAAMMGFQAVQLPSVASLTRDFVACLSPLSNACQLRSADDAATRLSQMLNALLNGQQPKSDFLADICRACTASNWQDQDALIANLIGVLSQTCEAGAGLIGNTLVALQQQPGLLEEVTRTPTQINELVAEVARFDSPVQNTRRFVTRQCTIGDSVLHAGDTVLLLLASANRDPHSNPDPDRFLLRRTHRTIYSFGHARHQCPGQQLALTIAAQSILALLQQPATSLIPQLRWSYLPSLNGRIPVWSNPLEPEQ